MTDEQLTALYNEANGITGKRLPITTARIFAAMRAAIAGEREACAKVCEARMERQDHEYREDIEAGHCAAAIRMRSNAKLSAGERREENL